MTGSGSARLIRVGCVAARALREGACGRVTAVFERSFYCTLDDQWMCVGPPGLGDGPLNAICHFIPRATFTIGDPVSLTSATLRIGKTFPLATGDAETWRPSAPRPWDETSLAAGLAAFAAALPATLPAEGLAALLRPREPLPPIAAAAHASAQHLQQIVRDPRRIQPSDAAPLAALLGLGPGLTPSGDDFLGGAMVALSLLGRTAVRDMIWVALAPQAAALTNDVSHAHLAAAAEGFGSAALHALLDDTLSAHLEALPARIAAMAEIGHTSGWDALAGAIAVLHAASHHG